MKNLSIRNKITVAFLVILMLLVTIGVVNFRQMNKLVSNSDWVSHTQKVLTELNHILGLLKDTETGQRGFIITGDEAYLEPFTSAKAELPIQIENLRNLPSDNQNQQNRITTLEGLIEQQLSES